jgi:hypothetical protein
LATPAVACEYGTNAKAPRTDRIEVVPTFHSLGVYWRPDGIGPDQTAHDGGQGPFRRSLDLVHVAEDGEYRGSIVDLRPGTAYTLRLVLGGTVKETVSAQTWCETFPIASTVYVPAGRQTAPLHIKGVTGSPTGWVLYTAAPGGNGVLDGGDVSHNVILENSSYVIVRGLTLANAQRHALYLDNNGSNHDLVIEDTIFEGWGRIEPTSGFGLKDHAIFSENGDGQDFARVIIRRNVFRNPRADTNNWTEIRVDRCAGKPRCHPYGPNAVHLTNAAGQIVIADNELYSTNGNYFNDGFGGAINDSSLGAPGRDSDIYGNLITNVWDDAIEAEGGGMNVRIWGNFIDETYVAFGLAPVDLGPSYVFRNIVRSTQRSLEGGPGSGVFIKTDSGRFGGGRLFVFHNTVSRGGPLPRLPAVRNGISSTGKPMLNLWSRNNIIESGKRAFSNDDITTAGTNSLDFDLYTGTLKNLPDQEPNGIAGLVTFAPFADDPWSLIPESLGVDTGVPIPNFNDDAVGAPDMGARER